MSLNNAVSIEGFIPNNVSLDEVIACDTKELEEIGGSFEEIADRMDYFIEMVETVYEDYMDKARRGIFRKYGYYTDELWEIPGSIRDPDSDHAKILKELKELRPWQILGEEHIEVVEVMSGHGMQWCPFDGCKPLDAGSNAEYRIRNRETGRELTINEITSHLARVHHLLQKGNQYGISAKEFYEHFMP